MWLPPVSLEFGHRCLSRVSLRWHTHKEKEEWIRNSLRLHPHHMSFHHQPKRRTNNKLKGCRHLFKPFKSSFQNCEAAQHQLPASAHLKRQHSLVKVTLELCSVRCFIQCQEFITHLNVSGPFKMLCWDGLCTTDLCWLVLVAATNTPWWVLVLVHGGKYVKGVWWSEHKEVKFKTPHCSLSLQLHGFLFPVHKSLTEKPQEIFFPLSLVLES